MSRSRLFPCIKKFFVIICLYMKSLARSRALKKRWEMIPMDVRTRMAQRAAKGRWLNVSKEDRLKHSVLMNNKRYGKVEA